MENGFGLREGIVETSNEGIVFIRLNSELYEAEAARAACYKFTSKAYILIRPFDAHEYIVTFEPKDNESCSLSYIAKEYANELLDQQIRLDLEKKYSKIREAIYTEAFRPTEGI